MFYIYQLECDMHINAKLRSGNLWKIRTDQAKRAKAKSDSANINRWALKQESPPTEEDTEPTQGNEPENEEFGETGIVIPKISD
jgi:hypothetical protein